MRKTSIFRALILCVMLSALLMCVVCAQTVTYTERAWDTSTAVVTETSKSTDDYTTVTSETVVMTSGNYVVSSDVIVSDRILVSGTVNLILCDGYKLIASNGISVNSGNTLNIFSQNDKGVLEAKAMHEGSGAAIGADIGSNSGTINIHGGMISASADTEYSAGIGASSDGYTKFGNVNGNITVYGGSVSAYGGSGAAAIGCSAKGTFYISEITIHGGYVYAVAGQSAAAIGGGENGGVCDITVNGGRIIAKSGKWVYGQYVEMNLQPIGKGKNGVGNYEVNRNGGFIIEDYNASLYSSAEIQQSITVGKIDEGSFTFYNDSVLTIAKGASLTVNCGFSGGGNIINNGKLIAKNITDEVNVTCSDDSVYIKNGAYQISNETQLRYFAGVVNGTLTDGTAQDKGVDAVLVSDIDLGNSAWTAIASTPLYYKGYGDDMGYSGNFDGNGHVIKNFYITGSNAREESYGLFGTVSGTVKNLGIDNFTFNHNGKDIRTGGVVGQLITSNALVSDCYVINSSMDCGINVTGGIAGCTYEGTIRNCYVYNNIVSGSINRFGHIVGDSRADGSFEDRKGTIENCYSDKKPMYSTYEGYTDGAALLTSSMLESGELATKLGGEWGQKLGEENSYPIMYGEKVYISYDGCEPIYSNTEGGNIVKGLHKYTNGVCTVCGNIQPAQYDSSKGAYEIKNAGNLIWFTDFVNSGNNSANAFLASDIILNENLIADGSLGEADYYEWTTPIAARDNSKYTGTFDGAGYTIYGLYVHDTNRSHMGLFGYIGENGTVKNLGIRDAYINIYSRSGIIAWQNEGTVNNCEVYGGYITATGKTVGAVGYNNGGRILNCFISIDAAASGYIGAVCGESYNGASIMNCHSASKITASGNKGALCGYAQDLEIKNSTYNSELCGLNAVSNTNAVLVNVLAKNSAWYSSGAAAWYLNGQSSVGMWGQKIGVNAYPRLKEKAVYAGHASGARCDDEVSVFSNTASEVTILVHNETDGFCSVCGKSSGSLTDSNSDNVYEISNASQLFAFAEAVNSGDKTISAILTASIDLKNREWTPIGSDSIPYSGTFNGNGKSITGFAMNITENGNHGFFVKTSGATVKDLYIDGLVNINIPSDNGLGFNYGFAAVSNNTTFLNIHSSVDVKVSTSNYLENSSSLYFETAAGIVGHANSDTVIERCTYSGTMDFSASGVDCWGGMIGYGNYNNVITIKDCAFIGTVINNNANYSSDFGGMLGYYRGKKISIKNCISAGTINIRNTSLVGVIAGSLRQMGNENIDLVTDNYYIASGSLNAFSSVVDTISGYSGYSDKQAKLVSDTVMASGEIAYILNENSTDGVWGQKIGTDKCPVLGGSKVYKVKGCDGESDIYSNYNTSGSHSFSGSSCSVCGYTLTYADRYYDSGRIVTKTMTPPSVQSVTADTTTLTSGWWVIDSDITASSRIAINGDVHLILMNGCTLTASRGIQVYTGNTLTIYGQDGDSGKIKATGRTNGHAGIGGEGYNKSSKTGKIVIKGGTIESSGAYVAAGIGGINYVIEIYGGNVTASGGSNSAGIGNDANAKYYGSGKTTVLGGNVTANGSNGAANIGMDTGSLNTRYISSVFTVINNVYTLTGSYNFDYDYTLPSGAQLAISSDNTLNVASGCTFINNGTLRNSGGTFNINGTLVNNGTLVCDENYHKYDNDCDNTCNFCSAQRTIEGHTYSGSCDHDCNKCGAVRSAAAHEYTNGICKTCNEYMAAVYNSQTNTYEISNKGQLLWFAAYANGTLYSGLGAQTTANAVLKCDIDIREFEGFRIGTSWANYGGTFDGGGYTLTVALSGTNDVAPFAYVNGATIKNLTVSGTITASGQYVSGLIARMINGNVNIEKCSIDVHITTTASSGTWVAGFIGFMNSGKSLTITDSAFTGSFEGSGSNDVCMVKNLIAKTNITNCFIAPTFGDVKHTGWDILIGGNNSYLNAKNTYVVESEDYISIFSLVADMADVTSGKITYILNNGVTDGTQTWYQTCGTGYPAYSGNTVYRGYDKCKPVYSNDASISQEISGHEEFDENGICSGCGDAYQPAVLENNVYKISNAGQLVWFAGVVNGTIEGADKNYELSAVLTSDIDLEGVEWTPIASTATYEKTDSTVGDRGYSGTFDGNGFVIRNVDVVCAMESSKSNGIFGTVSGTVKNLGVENVTVKSLYSYALLGGIAGQIVDGGSISDCYAVNVSMGGTYSRTGGIAGANLSGTIENCYAYGISSNGSYVGDITGLASDFGIDKLGTVRNCYSNGTIVHNKYNGGSEYIIDCQTVSDKDFEKGIITYLLNDGRSKDVWEQIIGTEKTPVFADDEKGDTVYKVKCEDGGETYRNINEDYTEHNFVDHYCTYCGAFCIKQDESGAYLINSAEDYTIFVAEVNSGKTSLSAKLMADIDLTDYTENIILGNSETMKYSGTLDGNGKTLTVKLNGAGCCAPIGYSGNATILNLTVDGTIEASDKFAGGIIGQNFGNTVIERCMVKLTINSSVSGDGTHGGFVGVSESGGTLKIIDSAFVGKITGSDTNSCGGFVGWSSGTTEITDSFVAGTFETDTSSCHTFGRNPGKYTIKNCYYLTAYGDVNDGAVQKTADEFASGELVNALNGENGAAWGQSIGKDAFPVINGETVYYDAVTDSYVNKYTVTLESGEGYTLTAEEGSASPVSKGGSYAFGITVLEGYVKTASFTVKANEAVLTENNGVYVINEITENITVTVKGIIAEGETIYGDYNGDGEVSVSDVIAILQYLASETDISEEQRAASDVNCDGKVDVSDVIRILQYLASPGSTVLGPKE